MFLLFSSLSLSFHLSFFVSLLRILSCGPSRRRGKEWITAYAATRLCVAHRNFCAYLTNREISFSTREPVKPARNRISWCRDVATTTCVLSRTRSVYISLRNEIDFWFVEKKTIRVTNWIVLKIRIRWKQCKSVKPFIWLGGLNFDPRHCELGRTIDSFYIDIVPR